MWNSMYFLGAFVGATGAGFLVENFNFEVASVYFWAAVLITIMVDLSELMRELIDTKAKQQQNIIESTKL